MFRSVILILILAFSLTGCASNSPTPDKGNIKEDRAKSNPPQSITINNIDFEVVNEVPELNEMPHDRGFRAIEKEDGYLILISMGEKNTGGYSIEVLNVVDNEGITTIITKVTAPEKDQITTQAITYPKTAIKIAKNISPNFYVVDDKGKAYNAIP